MLTNDELQAIRARAEAATPGPWRPFRCEEDGMPYISTDGGIIFDHREESVTFSDDDLAFVCASRTDIPALLAHIDHQQRALEWIADALKFFCDESICNDDCPLANVGECKTGPDSSHIVVAALYATREAPNDCGE